MLSFSSRVRSQPLLLHTCVLRLPKQLTVHKPEQLSQSIYKVESGEEERCLPSPHRRPKQYNCPGYDRREPEGTLQFSNSRSSVASGCPTCSPHWRQGPPAEQGRSGSSVLSGLSQGQERL